MSDDGENPARLSAALDRAAYSPVSSAGLRRAESYPYSLGAHTVPQGSPGLGSTLSDAPTLHEFGGGDNIITSTRKKEIAK